MPFIVVVKGAEDMRAAEFVSLYTEKISECLTKRDVEFWVTDQKGVAAHTIRMLETRQFQQCKVFHTRDVCEHALGRMFVRVGGYPSMAAIEAEFLVSANEIVEFASSG